ncbi:MAG: hypothetical protein ACPGWR_04125 [Ardenticatenaceae bacterium]
MKIVINDQRSAPPWRVPCKPLSFMKEEQIYQPRGAYPDAFYLLEQQADGADRWEQGLVACPYVPVSGTDGGGLPINWALSSFLDGASPTLMSILSKTHLFLHLEERKDVQNA